ncbi:MAG: hypothetical protein M0005_09805 [Actinomycetota bacterium]|jgi:hypothetical protein|nr:hypothetical protein [Actinomycetota bacterium]
MDIFSEKSPGRSDLGGGHWESCWLLDEIVARQGAGQALAGERWPTLTLTGS